MGEQHLRRALGVVGCHLLVLLTAVHRCKCFCWNSQQSKNTYVSTKRDWAPLLASSLENEGHDNSTLHRQSRLPMRQFGVDTDVMPRQEGNLLSTTTKFAFQDWGIEQQHDPLPTFPDSLEALADAAFEAIVGALNGEQCLDPNLASNAMSRSIFDYRPVRQERDSGRIGIEIDGAISFKRSDSADPTSHYDSNGSVLRQLMLVLAGKFAQQRWKPMDANATKSPPVAVYFNTVKQALAASHQLKLLQQQSSHQSSLYGNVTIHCLGQDDELPSSMCANLPVIPTKPGPKKRTSKKDTPLDRVDPSRGLVIVVQPTDFNDEYRPPGPAIGVLASFQKLVARASAEEVPVVMVSPRFFTDASFAAGWSQSTGSHQAAMYGGSEPPRGPTPWILRDFNPPVFSWIGNAVSLTAKDRLHQQGQDPHKHHKHKTDSPPRTYSQLAMTQSVMHEGHQWHVFAARNPSDVPKEGKKETYDYLASTKSSAGRPTQAILRRILGEFGS